MKEENVFYTDWRPPVIVLDLANYKASYGEEVPFKAEITKTIGGNIWVKSIITEKEYELYSHQILELMDIEEIKNLIDLSKYGL